MFEKIFKTVKSNIDINKIAVINEKPYAEKFSKKYGGLVKKFIGNIDKLKQTYLRKKYSK